MTNILKFPRFKTSANRRGHQEVVIFEPDVSRAVISYGPLMSGDGFYASLSFEVKGSGMTNEIYYDVADTRFFEDIKQAYKRFVRDSKKMHKIWTRDRNHSTQEV